MVKNLIANIAAITALALAIFIIFATFRNSRLQHGVQGQQDQIVVIQSEIQSLQQEFQSQQQRIEAATQLANQAGPAILNELASLQIKNNNTAISAFLQKHGIQASPPPAQSIPPGKPPRSGN